MLLNNRAHHRDCDRDGSREPDNESDQGERRREGRSDRYNRKHA